MTKKSDAPAIRFKGFSDAWEQRKAKELFVSTADKGYPELPVLSATQDRGMIRRDENSINIFHDKKNEAGYKRVLPGQFVIHLRSFQGGFAHSAIEGITSPAYTVFGFSEPEKHDSEYWKYVFTSKPFIQRLETVTYGIRDGRSISYEEFLTLGFVYPSKAEQTAIARYLDKLSDLITLHQRKCVFLFGFFQAFISMIFTASTFSWEQRKLGEIGSVSMCRRIFKEQTSENGEIPFYKIGTFGGEADAFISRELFEEYKAKYQYPKKGDILISASGSIGRTVVFTGKNEYFQDSNIVWLNHDKHLDNSFLKCFYSIVKWAGIEGSTIKRLYNDNILNTAITLPSVEEQQKIGAYFENLDNLITLHQRECISFTARAGRLILTANKKRNTSSWEQRKAKEICSIGTGKSNTQDQVDDGKFPFYIRSDVPVRSNKYLYDCEAVITIGDGNIGKVFHYVNGKFDLHQRCYKMTDFKDIWGKYFFYYFSTKFYDRAMKMTAKATVDSVRLEMISEMDIKKPPQISEQKQIAEFFANLDNLITLHQRKPFLMKWRTSDANRNQTNRLVL